MHTTNGSFIRKFHVFAHIRYFGYFFLSSAFIFVHVNELNFSSSQRCVCAKASRETSQRSNSILNYTFSCFVNIVRSDKCIYMVHHILRSIEFIYLFSLSTCCWDRVRWKILINFQFDSVKFNLAKKLFMWAYIVVNF